MDNAGSSRPIRIDLSGKRRETFESVFYRWAINVGKTLIVLVELIALSALFYRFVIDRQLVDQRDELAQKAFLVKAQRGLEEEFLAIHARTDAVVETQNSTEAVFNLVTTIRQALDEGRFESGEVIINQDIVSFQGRAFSVFDVQNFVDELSQNSHVESISLDEITSSDLGIRFSMTIQLATAVRNL